MLLARRFPRAEALTGLEAGRFCALLWFSAPAQSRDNDRDFFSFLFSAYFPFFCFIVFLLGLSGLSLVVSLSTSVCVAFLAFLSYPFPSVCILSALLFLPIICLSSFFLFPCFPFSLLWLLCRVLVVLGVLSCLRALFLLAA